MRRPSTRFLAAALFALTTILVGFAHRPFAAGLDESSPGALQVLPGGYEVSICGHVGEEPGAPPSGSAVALCDACLLSSAPGLGAIAEIVLPARVFGGAVEPVVGTQASSPRVVHSPTARGPPVAV